ncbi:TRAP transporter small permease [Piscinibacter sakaiensis]|uniref:TRAP transporter small permease n=1 Tax=Piscinibacter sakaiensis TaxID=1547922 RepID=UPI003AAE7DAC
MERDKKRGVERLLDLLGVGAGAVFGLIALATTYDVLLRSATGDTLAGLAELVEYTLFASTFLAAPWLLRHNGHVQVDFAVGALPERPRRLVRRIADGIGLLVCLVLLVYSVQVTWTAWRDGSIVLKTLVFPEWWLFAVVVVSMALLVLEFARRLWIGQVEPSGARDF